MIRRLALLITTAVLAVSVAAGVRPPVAQAAATCATHDLDILNFYQGGPVDTFYVFQCGGGSNVDYKLYFVLQYKSKTGVWHDGVCDGGFPAHTCDRDDPNTGWNGGGTKQNVRTSFQPDPDFTPICWPAADHMLKSWRVRMVVSFRNGDPNASWNSSAAASGWCPV